MLIAFRSGQKCLRHLLMHKSLTCRNGATCLTYLQRWAKNGGEFDHPSFPRWYRCCAGMEQSFTRKQVQPNLASRIPDKTWCAHFCHFPTQATWIYIYVCLQHRYWWSFLEVCRAQNSLNNLSRSFRSKVDQKFSLASHAYIDQCLTTLQGVNSKPALN